MNAIRLSYAPLQNAGDLLNKELVEKLSGREVVNAKMYNADMIAIGGALIGAQYSGGISRRLCQWALRYAYGNKPLYVWGSGFFREDNSSPLYRTNLKVCALRGRKTQEKLTSLTGEQYDVPLADAGLLADLFVEPNIPKEFEVGVIPHLSQLEDPAFRKMLDQESARLIDIRRSPKAVIDDIAKCECIISSSLHGLVFADSLHIPSLHVLGSQALYGGNFKFEDYYSSFGLEDRPYVLDGAEIPNKKAVLERYCISPDQVEEKKEQLIQCFPRF
jgi:hypothetical protein